MHVHWSSEFPSGLRKNSLFRERAASAESNGMETTWGAVPRAHSSWKLFTGQKESDGAYLLPQPQWMVAERVWCGGGERALEHHEDIRGGCVRKEWASQREGWRRRTNFSAMVKPRFVIDKDALLGMWLQNQRNFLGMVIKAPSNEACQCRKCADQSRGIHQGYIHWDAFHILSDVGWEVIDTSALPTQEHAQTSLQTYTRRIFLSALAVALNGCNSSTVCVRCPDHPVQHPCTQYSLWSAQKHVSEGLKFRSCSFQ